MNPRSRGVQSPPQNASLSRLLLWRRDHYVGRNGITYDESEVEALIQQRYVQEAARLVLAATREERLRDFEDFPAISKAMQLETIRQFMAIVENKIQTSGIMSDDPLDEPPF